MRDAGGAPRAVVAAVLAVEGERIGAVGILCIGMELIIKCADAGSAVAVAELPRAEDLPAGMVDVAVAQCQRMLAGGQRRMAGQFGVAGCAGVVRCRPGNKRATFAGN